MAIRGQAHGGNANWRKFGYKKSGQKVQRLGALSTFIKAKLFLSVYIDNIRIVGRREWKLSSPVGKAAKED